MESAEGMGEEQEIEDSKSVNYFFIAYLFFSPIAHASIESFTGCFQASEYNGRPLEVAEYPSEIKLIPAIDNFRSVDEKDLAALELKVAVPNYQFPSYYVSQVIVEGAQIVESENVWDMTFDGPVLNLFTGKVQKIRQQTKIEKIGDLLAIEIVGAAGNHESAQLARIPCP